MVVSDSTFFYAGVVIFNVIVPQHLEDWGSIKTNLGTLSYITLFALVESISIFLNAPGSYCLPIHVLHIGICSVE